MEEDGDAAADVERKILSCCNDLLLVSSTFAPSLLTSSAAWSTALRKLRAVVHVPGHALASSVLLGFLRKHPHLPDSVTDAIAHSIAQCCGSCSAPASTLVFTFSPSLTLRIKEMDYVKGGFGWKVWGTALLLSLRVVKMQESFRGRRVLELGSGCGLCGLLAAKVGSAEVILSDHVPEILANLCGNAFLSLSTYPMDLLSDDITSVAAGGKEVFDYVASGCGDVSGVEPCAVHVRFLDWLEDTSGGGATHHPKEKIAHIPRLYDDETFDWIIGSDLIYNHDSLQALACVIHRRLERMQGQGLFAAPVRDKQELDLFVMHLDKLGMVAHVEYCSEEEWIECLLIVGAVKEGGTLHGIDHYEGGLVIIHVIHKEGNK